MAIQYWQLSATLLAGGLAGSVFTWYMNRPKATIITYSASTTTLRGDSVTSLIPDLKIQIAGKDVPVINTHTVEIVTPPGNYLDSAEIAIAFAAPIHLLGRILTSAPSSIHHITCTQVSTGANCTIAPLSSGSTYRISMATDEQRPPTAIIASKNTQLIRSDAVQLGIGDRSGLVEWFFGVIVGGLIAIGGLTIWASRRA